MFLLIYLLGNVHSYFKLGYFQFNPSHTRSIFFSIKMASTGVRDPHMHSSAGGFLAKGELDILGMPSRIFARQIVAADRNDIWPARGVGRPPGPP